jgi:asparagine synthase (glutamine-hydrolysing)
MYVWNKSVLTNMDLVCLGERMEMAHSIESRLPFLDHHLTEYVNSLPPSMKIRKDSYRDTFTGKWILRKAAKPFITKEVYHRKKHVSS